MTTQDREMFLILRGPREDRFRVSYRSKIADGQAECVWEEGKLGEIAHMGQFVYGSREDYEAAVRAIGEFAGGLRPGTKASASDLYSALSSRSIEAYAV